MYFSSRLITLKCAIVLLPYPTFFYLKINVLILTFSNFSVINNRFGAAQEFQSTDLTFLRQLSSKSRSIQGKCTRISFHNIVHFSCSVFSVQQIVSGCIILCVIYLFFLKERIRYYWFWRTFTFDFERNLFAQWETNNSKAWLIFQIRKH